jgi:hypothetical protein
MRFFLLRPLVAESDTPTHARARVRTWHNNTHHIGRYRCLDGVCCAGIQSEARMACVDNSSAYGFVLGGIDAAFGVWHQPATWTAMSVSASTRWGTWSSEFNQTMAAAAIQRPKGGFYEKYPLLGLQLGVRSSKLVTHHFTTTNDATHVTLSTPLSKHTGSLRCVCMCVCAT